MAKQLFEVASVDMGLCGLADLVPYYPDEEEKGRYSEDETITTDHRSY